MALARGVGLFAGIELVKDAGAQWQQDAFVGEPDAELAGKSLVSQTGLKGMIGGQSG